MQAPPTTTPSFNRRLTVYSTLAAAGACAVVTLPTEADASVVYSGPMNANVPATVTGDFVNLTTFQVGLTYAAVNGGDSNAAVLNLWGTSAFRAWIYPTTSTVNRFVSVGANPAELIAGAVINAASTYGTTTTPTALAPGGAWVAGTTGYLGFKFLSGGLTLFGWAQLFVPNGTPSSTNQMVLIDMAFENSGAAILAGQTGAPAVPDSGSTLALLAAGCAATVALGWRRRKVTS